MEKPKNCPFCDGEAEIWQKMSRNGEYMHIFIRCAACGARGKQIISLEVASDIEAQEAAVEAWNRRI